MYIRERKMGTEKYVTRSFVNYSLFLLKFVNRDIEDSGAGSA